MKKEKKESTIDIPVTIGNEEFRIQADSMCWMLCKVSKRKGDKIYWQPFSYFSTLPSLLNQLMDLKLRKAQATSFEDIRNNLINFNKELKPLLKFNISLPYIEELKKVPIG